MNNGQNNLKKDFEQVFLDLSATFIDLLRTGTSHSRTSPQSELGDERSGHSGSWVLSFWRCYTRRLAKTTFRDTMLEQYCNSSIQCRNNVVML